MVPGRELQNPSPSPSEEEHRKGKGGTLGVWSVLTFVQVGKKMWWLKLGVIPNCVRSWNSLVAGQ